MNSRACKEAANLLMRKRKVCLALSFVAACFFYVTVVKEKVEVGVFTAPEPCCPPLATGPTTYEQPDDTCSQENLVYGEYCVISPYHEEQRDIRNLGLLTLCTQGTLEFLHHVLILCSRWNGPMSVAVFTPPEDYVEARNLVSLLRDCDFCVRHWVSWHFFFQKQTMPDFVRLESFADCHTITSRGNGTLKRRSEGPYPINVGRNIARNKTFTPYIFSIDIELYPSAGVLSKFERLVRSSDIPEGHPQVWVLPVFEVQSKFRAPTTKSSLKSMYYSKQVISFHKYRCNECHKIPNLTQWFNLESTILTEEEESTDTLKVWTTVKRSKKYHQQYWEPFFIGTRDDPEFDPRLSWEGKQNKMQVAYEMCLRKYDFHIVENAFLVHSPGINVYNASKEKYRMKYQHKNNKWMSVIKKNLGKKYGHNKDC